jgi:hypothetical protein
MTLFRLVEKHSIYGVRTVLMLNSSSNIRLSGIWIVMIKTCICSKELRAQFSNKACIFSVLSALMPYLQYPSSLLAKLLTISWLDIMTVDLSQLTERPPHLLNHLHSQVHYSHM